MPSETRKCVLWSVAFGLLIVLAIWSAGCSSSSIAGPNPGGGGGGGGGGGTPTVALWIADGLNRQLLGFTPNQIQTSGSPAAFVTISAVSNGAGITVPQSMTFDSAGDMWVSNTSSSFPLVMFQPVQLTTGGPQGAFIAIGTDGLGDLVDPHGIVFDSSQNLWVAVPGKNLLLAYAPSQVTVSGNPLANIVIGTNILDAPNALAFDGSGNLWVANSGNNQLLEFAASQITQTGNPFPVVQIQSFALSNPSGLAFDSSGNLWVTNSVSPNSNGTIVEFTAAQLATSGGIAPTFTLNEGSGTQPYALVFDSGQNLWVSNLAAKSVVEFTSTQLQGNGSTTPSLILQGNFQPNAIVFQP